MCEFPSGYKFPDGTVKYHTDSDIIAAHEKSGDPQPLNWADYIGHSGWEKCFGNPPDGSVSVESSEACKLSMPDFSLMKEMAKHCDRLDVRGCDLKGVTLPTTIEGSLDVRGCDLKGVTLPTTIGGWLDVRGCDLKGVTLPTTIEGGLYVSGCDLKGVTLPKGVKVFK